MKVLFVGLGSIGTRHLKNLTAVCNEKNIPLTCDALRSSNRELPQQTAAMLNEQYLSYGEAGEYDAVFITNPTNLHYEAIKALSGKAKALFIEKPIFEATGYSLADCGLLNKKAYVAAPMRWCKTYLELKNYISKINCYSARVICSSYLPDWRKGVDYRKVYSAIKAMGGGVTIDLIHEWDYVVDLLGTPIECFNFKGTYSHLEIDSDDLSVYIARYKDKLCEIHLDYFGREYRRSIELFCKNGTVTADFGAGTLTKEDGTVVNCAEDVNERYIREMSYFVDFALGKENKSINTPSLALDTLKLTLGEN